MRPHAGKRGGCPLARLEGGDTMSRQQPTCKIKQQGSPIFNSAALLCNHPDVAVIEIDMKSKYCDVELTGSDCCKGSSIPLIVIAANDRSLHLHPRKDRNAWTEISFPAFDGFSVMATGSGRYTITVCLVNIEKVRDGLNDEKIR
jgi:hypothetical protein